MTNGHEFVICTSFSICFPLSSTNCATGCYAKNNLWLNLAFLDKGDLWKGKKIHKSVCWISFIWTIRSCKKLFNLHIYRTVRESAFFLMAVPFRIPFLELNGRRNLKIMLSVAKLTIFNRFLEIFAWKYGSFIFLRLPYNTLCIHCQALHFN